MKRQIEAIHPARSFPRPIIRLLLALCPILSLPLSAQISIGPDEAQDAQLIPSSPTISALSAPVVIQRGPHGRLWQQITLHTNQLGRVFAKTNSVTELATSMHYSKGGEW